MGAATRALIFINVLVYLGQISSNGALTDFLYYSPMSTLSEPWRMITSGFAHDASLATNPMSILHIGLNMYTLYILGNLLEPMLGARRFTILYLLSIFGGSVLVLLVGNPIGGVLGASGGIFGLMAAFFVVLRTLGATPMRSSALSVSTWCSHFEPGCLVAGTHRRFACWRWRCLLVFTHAQFSEKPNPKPVAHRHHRGSGCHQLCARHHAAWLIVQFS